MTMTVQVRQRGTLTLPAALREKYRIRRGDTFSATFSRDTQTLPFCARVNLYRVCVCCSRIYSPDALLFIPVPHRLAF